MGEPWCPTISKAAGAALYVNKAFRNPFLTFLITVCMLSASFAAARNCSSRSTRAACR